METIAEQRKAWQAIHTDLINYVNQFGPIQVGEEDGHFFIDWASGFPECGKIHCPDYRFSVGNKKKPWYTKFRWKR